MRGRKIEMNTSFIIEDENSLKKFLLDEDCLEELTPWTRRFNIFDVLKISRTEIRHSNMLGWLLDPNENHGLEDKLLRALFHIAVSGDEEYNVFNFLLLDFHSFVVLREWKNIDMLLLSKEEKTLVAIENKIGSCEHSNQLHRYHTILEKEFENYNKIYLYLTPDGESSSCPEIWKSISYQELVEEIESIIYKVKLLPEAELMIKNYIEVLRRDIVEDQELIEICNRIYQKHKRAFDLIYDNKTDNRTLITDLILEPLKDFERKNIIKIESSAANNTIIPFSTEAMTAFLPEDDKNKSSWGTHSIYRYFFILRDYPNITAKFEIGGSNYNPIYAEKVDQITRYFKPRDARGEFKFKRLFSTKKYVVDEDNVEESCRKIVRSIVTEILKKEKEALETILE